jgi:hypothetical protein
MVFLVGRLTTQLISVAEINTATTAPVGAAGRLFEKGRAAHHVECDLGASPNLTLMGVRPV